MAQIIPEGYAFVARGDRTRREAATELLARAEKAGLEASSIRVTNGGYYVPEDLVKSADDTEQPQPQETPPEVLEQHSGQVDLSGVGNEDAADVPAKNASKADWVAYAEAQGYDSSEDLTKQELIEKYGG